MLYGLDGENSSVLSNYTGDEHSNYKNYLSALINHMTLNTNLVVTTGKIIGQNLLIHLATHLPQA